MKTKILIILILSFFLGSDIYAIVNSQKSEIDSLVNKYARPLMNDTSMVGLSLGIYYKDENFFFNYGNTVKGGQTPPTKNTVYEIGSITKTFTGIILSHAVTENKIDLNDDIRTYLNEEFDNLNYDGMPIKIINLANHSSGLPEDIIPTEFNSLKNPTMFDIINIFENDKGSMFLRDLHNVKIDFEPGHMIRYSNTGMIILGIILENIYNTSYAELIYKYFRHPYGMNNTETVYYKSDTDNYTKGYDKKGQVMPHITFQIAGAAGGLKSTTHDMIIYIRENIKVNVKAIQLSQESTIDKNGQEIGLGWQIRTDLENNKILWHDGGEPGFSSYIAILPDKNIGIICLMNQRGRQNQLEDLSKKIIKEIVEK